MSVAELVAIEEWPHVIILTTEEEKALRTQGEVTISMLDIDSDTLALYYGEA